MSKSKVASNQGAKYGLNPISIVNIQTATQTMVNFVNSTFYSTATATVQGIPVTTTETSISEITQTLTIPPLLTTTTVTSTITSPTTITNTESGTTATLTVSDPTTITQTSTHLAYYTETTTVVSGVTHVSTQIITQTATAGSQPRFSFSIPALGIFGVILILIAVLI